MEDQIEIPKKEKKAVVFSVESKDQCPMISCKIFLKSMHNLKIRQVSLLEVMEFVWSKQFYNSKTESQN